MFLSVDTTSHSYASTLSPFPKISLKLDNSVKISQLSCPCPLLQVLGFICVLFFRITHCTHTQWPATRWLSQSRHILLEISLTHTKLKSVYPRALLWMFVGSLSWLFVTLLHASHTYAQKEALDQPSPTPELPPPTPLLSITVPHLFTVDTMSSPHTLTHSL